MCAGALLTPAGAQNSAAPAPGSPASSQSAPAPAQYSITITDSISTHLPGSTTVLDSSDLEAAPGVNLDQKLRTVPGFSLLRRSSSIVAHPTTQGVSLRGIGSNGASRTLVLWDGIPLNDPFGGWVYWTCVPAPEIERVEVSPGSSASVFGDRAMGGVVSLFSRPPQPRNLSLSYESGSWGSADAFAAFSTSGRGWALAAGGKAFRTDGYYIVPETLRGSIDRRAYVRFASGFAAFDLIRAAADRLSFKIDLLAEQRGNGAVLQTNSTSLGTISAHYERASLSLLAWHTREALRASFSAVSADRDSERLTFRQTAPANATGGAGVWERRFGGTEIKLGADSVRNEGYSTDRLQPAGLRTGGGILWTGGAFAQTDFSHGPLVFFAGLRGDSPGRGPNFLNPSAGVAVARGGVRGWFSFYRGFRAPTLNELYREFRVGNAVTLANNALGAERMTSLESGASLAYEGAVASLALYRNSLEDFITNVTLSVSPQLIVRQRQNAGRRTRARRSGGRSPPVGPLRGASGLPVRRFALRQRLPHPASPSPPGIGGSGLEQREHVALGGDPGLQRAVRR